MDASPRMAFFTGPQAAQQAAAFTSSLFSGDYPYLQIAQDVRLFDSMVSEVGGLTSFSFSAKQKELRIYEHDPVPYAISRHYLEDRDELAWEATTGFAGRMWNAYPKLADPRHKTFLETLDDAMFLKTMPDLEAMGRRDGKAWLYIRATGKSSDPILPGDRPISFSPISSRQITDSHIEEYDGDDPLLLQHGIKSVSIETMGADGKPQHKEVHGHRIFPILRNRGRGYLWPSYDSIWYTKDLLFSLRMAQYGGNPIAIEVDAKFLELVGEDLSEPEMQQLKKNILTETGQIQEGSKHSYSPMKGLIIKRVGAPGLDDPIPILRQVAQRISMPTGMSANRIHGLSQMTAEDRSDEDTWIHERRVADARALYKYLLDLLRLMGAVPARTPPLPLEMKWPYARILNPREIAYVKGKDASTLKAALQSGYYPDSDIMEQFTKVDTPFDPRTILPNLGPVVPDIEGVVQPPVPSSSSSKPNAPAAAAMHPDLHIEEPVLSYAEEQEREEEELKKR